MADTITERQGDKIISLLGDILWELKQMKVDTGHIESSVSGLDLTLSSMDRTLDSIDSKTGD
jgi:hypothetical protein